MNIQKKEYFHSNSRKFSLKTAMLHCNSLEIKGCLTPNFSASSV